MKKVRKVNQLSHTNTKYMNDNFGNLPKDSALPNIEMSDPMGTNSPDQSAGGKTKIRPTDKSGSSYQGTNGYGFMVNGEKVMPNGGAPGNGNGSITDNNGQGNSSGIPAAQPIPIMTFGDPADTGLDFKDGMDRNTVTIQGGGTNDIAGYDITKPNPMGG